METVYELEDGEEGCEGLFLCIRWPLHSLAHSTCGYVHKAANIKESMDGGGTHKAQPLAWGLLVGKCWQLSHFSLEV